MRGPGGDGPLSRDRPAGQADIPQAVPRMHLHDVPGRDTRREGIVRGPRSRSQVKVLVEIARGVKQSHAVTGTVPGCKKRADPGRAVLGEPVLYGHHLMPDPG